MSRMQTRTFGITSNKPGAKKANKPPVKRVWGTTKSQEELVPYHRHPISSSIVDDDEAMAKEIHRAVMKWRELTGLEHYGHVYVELQPTGETTVDENGESALQVRAFIVVESAPKVSAR